MKRGAALVAGVIAAACTIQTIFPFGSGSAAGTASQLVGAGGGTVTTNDGTTLVIPPGALPSNVTITIGLDPSAPPLTPANPLTAPHVFGPPGQQFLLPVCVTLAFEPPLLPEGTTEKNVVVYATPQDSGAYVPLPTFSADSSHVTAMTTSFATLIAGYGSALEIAPPDGGADASDGPFGCPVPTDAGEGGLGEGP